MSAEDNPAPLQGKVVNMSKAECQRLARYLRLDASGTLPALRPHLQEHLDHNLGHLAGNPVLSALFYGSTRLEKPRKTSTDKAQEESVIHCEATVASVQ
jgi:hypothetical protein